VSLHTVAELVSACIEVTYLRKRGLGFGFTAAIHGTEARFDSLAKFALVEFRALLKAGT
jgi:hypothetical protein